MPRGISLHVGINKYSSAFPGAQPLEGCESDAKAMAKIAEDNGFEQRDLLLGCEATYMRVTTKIRSAAAELEPDDIFFFSFAGHGFQHGDELIGGDEREDGLDETLLLFDAELFDDVLRKELWPRFKPGVRVLMVADSCHSGTANTAPPDDNEADNSIIDDMPVTSDGGPIRSVKHLAGERHMEEYREFYRSIQLPSGTTINASVLLLAACLDHQTTGDGKDNGVYTDAMLKVLESNPVDYVALRDGIEKRFRDANRRQTPKISRIGTDFSGQRPFTVKVE